MRDDDVTRERLTALRHEVLALDRWLSALVPLSATAKRLGINAGLAATRHGAAGQPLGIVAEQLAEVTGELRSVGTEVRDGFGAVSRRLAAMSRNELRLRMLARADALADGQIAEVGDALRLIGGEVEHTLAELERELGKWTARVSTLRSDAEVIMASLGVSARIEAVRLGEDVIASAEAIQQLAGDVRSVVERADAAAATLLRGLAEIDIQATRAGPSLRTTPGR